jgi:hypothetical protein
MINDKELNETFVEWFKNDMDIKSKNLEELRDITSRLFNVERALKSEEYAHKKEIIRVQLRFVKIAFWACGLGFVVGALTHFKLIIS